MKHLKFSVASLVLVPTLVFAAEIAVPTSSSDAPKTGMIDETKLKQLYDNAEFAKCMKPNPEAKKDDITYSQHFRKVDPKELPAVGAEGDLAGFKKGLAEQIKICEKRQSQGQKFNIGGRSVTLKTLCVDTNKRLLEIANSPDVKNFANLMSRARSEFDWYRNETPAMDEVAAQNKVKFSSYHAPTLEVSRKADNVYKYPIHRKPSDIVMVKTAKGEVTRKKNADGTISSYDTREDIHNGSLNGKKTADGKDLVIAYAKDEYDLYMFQVEGAGTLITPQKEHIQVNFASSNGHPYGSVSRALKCAGASKEMTTVKGTKAFLKSRPGLEERLLNAVNKSYIFFDDDGKNPKGMYDVELTPRHSLATDQRGIPFGSMVWMSTERPKATGKGSQPFSTLGMANDRGGAIKRLSDNRDRIDWYAGDDDYAMLAGSDLSADGSAFIALPKE